MPIHTILFDFGNVVGYFDHRRATRRFVEQSSMSESEIFDAIYNTKLEDDFEAGRIGTDEFVAQAMATIHYRGTSDQFIAEFVDIFTPNDDVCQLIPRLADRYRLVAASNTNPLHSRHFCRQFADVLARFTALGFSFEARSRKPHPPFYAHCQSFAAGSADGCLFVDDIATNVEAARAFGWQAIQYRTFEDLQSDLRARGIDT